MLEHDLKKIDSAVSKHSANLKGSGLSTKNLAEYPKKWRSFIFRISSFLDVWAISEQNRTLASPSMKIQKYVFIVGPSIDCMPIRSGLYFLFFNVLFSVKINKNIRIMQIHIKPIQD